MRVGSVRTALKWITLLALPLPFFFNCHRGTDLSAEALSSQSLPVSAFSSGEERSPASVDSSFPTDTALVSASPDTSKVVLSLNQLVSTPLGGSSGLMAKASSAPELALPENSRILVTVDNECLRNRMAAQATGARKASAESLSEKALAASGAEPIDGLKQQSYSFATGESVPLSALSQEAETDDCVLRVANDERSIVVPPVRAIGRPVSPSAFERAGAAAASGSQQKLSAEDASAGLESEERSARVLAATNDPGLSYQKHIVTIRAAQAWSLLTNSSKGLRSTVTVAIVDSGVDYRHADLTANMWQNSSGQFGYDFENSDSDPDDDNGHGTHVAGLVGAVGNNGIGVTGVMGHHVKLMAVKVTDSDGAGFPSVIANGIRWAADQGAEVINLSLGYNGTSIPIKDAVTYATSKGVVVVTAAGNDNLVLSSTNVVTPASFATSTGGAIAVGSIDSETGMRSSFSNYSPSYVYISAPGSNGIWSTWAGGEHNLYNQVEGTSMASPITAGAAALAISLIKSEGLTPVNTEIVNLLTSSARSSSNLSTAFRNGATLDLERLTVLIKNKYLVDSEGGTEGVQ